jgi:hypothetical protein
MPRHLRHMRLCEPATYVILVGGALDPDWSERLGGMRIRVIDADRQATTELIGSVPDQSALLGILEMLHDLGMPVLSLEFVPRHYSLPR